MKLLLDIIFAAISLLSGLNVWNWYREKAYFTYAITTDGKVLDILLSQLVKGGYFEKKKEEISSLWKQYSERNCVGNILTELSQYKKVGERARNIWIVVFLIVLLISLSFGGIIVVIGNAILFFVSFLFTPTKSARESVNSILAVLLWNMFWYFRKDQGECVIVSAHSPITQGLYEAVKRHSLSERNIHK